MRKSDVDIYLLKYNLECAIPKNQHFSERGRTNHEIFIGW